MYTLLNTIPLPIIVLKNGFLVAYNQKWSEWIISHTEIPSEFLLLNFNIVEYLATYQTSNSYLQILHQGIYTIAAEHKNNHTERLLWKTKNKDIFLLLHFSKHNSEEIVITHQEISHFFENPSFFPTLAQQVSSFHYAQQVFDAFFELFPDLFCVCYPDGRLKQVNFAWQSLLGDISYTHNDFFSFVNPEEIDMARRNLNAILQTKILKSYTNRVVSTKNGAQYWITWNGIFEPHQQHIYLLGRDVTLLFDSQAKLVDSINKLQKLNHDFVEINEELIKNQEALRRSLEEKQRILLSLQRSEALYRSITNFTPGYSFMIIDKEFRYLLADGQGLSSLGFSKEQLLSKTVFDAHTREELNELLPRYHKMMRGEIVQTEYWKDSKFFKEVAIPIFNQKGTVEFGIIIVQEDTEKMKAEKEIYFQANVLRNVKDAIIVTSLQGIIIYYNKGAEKTFGYTAEEMIGKSVDKLYPIPRFIEVPLENSLPVAFNTLTPYRDFTGEWQTSHKNGNPVWIELTTTCLYGDQKKIIAFISIAKDITDRKLAQEELIKSNRELTNKNNHLSQYAYVTSHNLRAPVTRIMGLLELFNHEKMEDPFNQEIIQKIKEVTHHLDSVIRDLVSITDFQNKTDVTPEYIDLHSLIQEILTSLRDKIDAIQAQIHLKIQQTPTIVSVRLYLQSILFNLISNALKYYDPMKPQNIQISTSKEKGKIILRVSDTGLGMDLNLIRDKLFGFYKRFHLHLEGKGLGLYMVKKQVEALGGEIQVESEPYKGSTFTIFLPELI